MALNYVVRFVPTSVTAVIIATAIKEDSTILDGHETSIIILGKAKQKGCMFVVLDVASPLAVDHGVSIE
jgi:hypothetical protein